MAHVGEKCNYGDILRILGGCDIIAHGGGEVHELFCRGCSQRARTRICEILRAFCTIRLDARCTVKF